jgi:hypothetical protein
MPASVDIKVSFGARGDGSTDDTQAFLDAIEAVTDQGVIYIPPGTYVISQKIDVPKRVVFKGAGSDNTTLLFTKSLTDLEGNRWANGNSQYTYGPALMNFWGTGRTDASTLLGTVNRCVLCGVLVMLCCYNACTLQQLGKSEQPAQSNAGTTA